MSREYRDVDGGFLDEEELLAERNRRPSPGKVPATSGYSTQRQGSGSAGKVSLTGAMYAFSVPRRIDRTATGRRLVGDPAPSLARARSTVGETLPADMQRSLGIALGTDLSSVTIHTASESQEAAEAIGAKAYAEGQQIHFAVGQYSPETEGGKRLLAHEVAHTVQQRGASQTPQAKLEVSSPGDAHEREADAFADAFVAGRRQPVRLTATNAAIARKTRGTSRRPRSKTSKRDEVVASRFRRLIRWNVPKSLQGKRRRAFLQAKRRKLIRWVSRLPTGAARRLAVRIRPGGDLFPDFKYWLATSVRRQIRALLGSMVALPGADGHERSGIGEPLGQDGDDSTVFEKDAKGREDEYVPSGNLAVRLSPTHYRLWGYDVDSALPRPEYDKALDEVAQSLIVDLKGYVYVTGHTSASGAERINSKLGEERAYRILEELQERSIKADRIFVLGEGAGSPLVKHEGNPAAMARNRRVELRLHLVSGVRTKKPKKKSRKWRIPCDAARFYRKYYLALEKAWTLSLPAGRIRDRGGDPRAAKPDRTHYRNAAQGVGFTSEQALLLYKNLSPLGHVPPPSPDDWKEWRRNIEFYERLENEGECDRNRSFTPGVFMTRRQKEEKEWPEPGDTAPGGQRY